MSGHRKPWIGHNQPDVLIASDLQPGSGALCSAALRNSARGAMGADGLKPSIEYNGTVINGALNVPGGTYEPPRRVRGRNSASVLP